MPLAMEAGLGPGHIVLDSAPLKGAKSSPRFSTHVCCGEMAAWIKMPLGMQVGVGPGDILHN